MRSITGARIEWPRHRWNPKPVNIINLPKANSPTKSSPHAVTTAVRKVEYQRRRSVCCLILQSTTASSSLTHEPVSKNSDAPCSFGDTSSDTSFDVEEALTNQLSNDFQRPAYQRTSLQAGRRKGCVAELPQTAVVTQSELEAAKEL